MNLKIRPASESLFPHRGFLVRGDSAREWILALQKLGIPWQELEVLPVPGPTAPSCWGCLVIVPRTLSGDDVGPHELCQEVFPNFYIPEKTKVSPQLSPQDREKLFPTGTFLFHPEVGFAPLDEQFRLADLVAVNPPGMISVRTPETGDVFPQTVTSFQVVPLSPEEAMEQLEKKVAPGRQEVEENPLSWWEKARLFVYKNAVMEEKGSGEAQETELKSWSRKFFNLFSASGEGKESMEDQIKRDYEDLEERNRKELDKLLHMLENQPDDALLYAVPLGINHSDRGGESVTFQHGKRRDGINLNFFSGLGGKGGGGVDMGDSYHLLYSKYQQMANDFEQQGKFEKAAFVYLKLLKRPLDAAKVLEKGQLYQEAAVIYEEKKSFLKAAECYEKGNMLEKAVTLYESEGLFEKAGDLYMQLNRKVDAMEAYQYEAERLLRKNDYLGASRIFEEKKGAMALAQATRLDGWRSGHQAYHCLRQYLDHIPELLVRKKAIDRIYKHDVSGLNAKTFLKIVLDEFGNENEMADAMKEMGYEIISRRAQAEPQILHFLKDLNPMDQEVGKDILRHQSQRPGRSSTATYPG